MITSRSSRFAGAALLALTLTLSTPAFAIMGSGGGSDASTAPTTTSPQKASGPTLASIQAEIDASNWTQAITDLKVFLKANPKSADGWNMLGFSYRNHGDLKLSDGAYDRALKIDPNHTGALSYQGILYIQMGKTDEAKANLAKIEQICGNTTCAAYTALAKALG